jgi:hypothetical protein
MAGKMSKTNVAARRDARAAAKKTCPHCGGDQEVALVVQGRGKTQMVRLCCERAAAGAKTDAAG